MWRLHSHDSCQLRHRPIQARYLRILGTRNNGLVPLDDVVEREDTIVKHARLVAVDARLIAINVGNVIAWRPATTIFGSIEGQPTPRAAQPKTCEQSTMHAIQCHETLS
jgi:hypothetical protein